MNNNTNREHFSSRLGVLLAMAGGSIGLGNMWRFPYLVGKNGGAAFILVYLVFVVFLCLPILVSEYALGRRTQKNAFGAFRALSENKKWSLIGIFAVSAAVCVLSFYCVVGGWSVKYLLEALLFKMPILDSEYFGGFISSSWSPLIYTLIFLGMTGGVLVLGIQKGIERFSKVMMLLLFVLIVLIAIRSITLPGAAEGIKYLFVPDLSALDGKAALEALGQSFFSLSIGCGTVLTYGSYVKKEENIVSTSLLVALFDTTFALIAGLAIIPAVFAIAYMNGATPEIGAGPGLVFITLPAVFNEMPMGGFIAILFFLSLLIAAITSAISLMETFVTYEIEEWKVSRGRAVNIAFAICSVLGIFCSLSQGVLSNVKLFGLNIFDFFDKLSANVLMTGGGLLLVLFVGWSMKKEDYIDELSNGHTNGIPAWLLSTIYYLVKFVAPITIIVVTIANFIL